MADERYEIDQSDRRLIGALRSGGRLTNADLARRLGMARGTVQLRLRRLVDAGVITGWGPDLHPRATDHGVLAFVTLSIAQGTHDAVVDALAVRREVLEVHVVTGEGDLLCRLAARSNDHLHELIQAIVGIEGVRRSQSQLALDSPLQRTLADLVGE
ncbi:MAG: Lrp/AsnC family transcriptional regulator [Actinomycetota bacterium]